MRFTIRVALAGRTVDVETRHGDWLRVERDLEQRLDQLWPKGALPASHVWLRVAWHAMRRTGVEGTPETFDGLLDVIDEFPEVEPVVEGKARTDLAPSTGT